MSSLEVLVLGSGGPFVNARRASSSFVVFIDGSPRVLVDAGGGAFERVGRAGVAAADLGLVLLTHFHADHSGGLAPVVFSAFMEGRTRPLTLAGPAPRDEQPGAKRFAELLFGPEGAWSYLHSFEGFGIDVLEAPSETTAAAPQEVLSEGGLRVSSVAVPHGMMPTVAFRLDLEGGPSVVFSGDVQEPYTPLVELARGCDLLVCDFALPEREVAHGHLHAKPSGVGRMAKDAGCRKLLLTHVMPELEDDIPGALTLVRESYHGDLVVADDLLRVTIPEGG